MTNDPPLSDPVAYARDLSDDELREYETIYGPESREWIIAQRELARRSPPRVLSYIVAPLIWALLALYFILR